MYAELALYQASVRHSFTYAVPDDMIDVVQIGQLVEVAFRTGLTQAIITRLDETSSVAQPKPILQVISDEPVVTPLQIAVAQWMAEQTWAPLGACLWLTLPPGIAKRGAVLYTLAQKSADSFGETLQMNLLPDAEAEQLRERVINLLNQRGPLRAAQLDRALPRTPWRRAIRPLIANGTITAESILPEPEAKSRIVRAAQLAIGAEYVPDLIRDLARSPKQAAALHILAEQTGPVTLSWLRDRSGASTDSIQRLADRGWITLLDLETVRDPMAGRDYAASAPPPLTDAQQDVWRTVQHYLGRLYSSGDEPPTTFLLHGVTGSGKTEIYLRAIEYVLAQGRQAIVLVPEIALVAPTVGRFASRFPGRIAVVHSSLTDGEQYDTWRRARAGQIDIIVGARSALFVPLPDVGLVVIDEEHDDSYKQSPPLPPPYYHARDTAITMMRLNRGTVLLGSATPDVTTVFRARQGEIVPLALPNRVIVPRESGEAVAAALPQVEVIDMRQELRDGNRSMFSRALRTALQHTLGAGEQALLFLNRRGQASFVLCRDCGYVSRCPNCEIPLTYHSPPSSADGRLDCHYCGYSTVPPQECPSCKSKRIRYFGAGTAAVEKAVIEEFTGAQVLRWDRDTAQSRADHETIWQRFASGDANVLVGTQMIVKGLDLPRVTLMGVILADTALGLPDYRAGERTFQLLTQAAGRAGRGWRGGAVIFQTYQPEHYAIRAAALHDYETFYAQEVEYRRELRYPPYKRLVRFLFRNPNAAQAQRDAETSAETLRTHITERDLTATELIGPAPAFFSKLDNVYQWQIIARTTDPARLLDGFTTRSGWSVDVNPVEIL